MSETLSAPNPEVFDPEAERAAREAALLQARMDVFPDVATFASDPANQYAAGPDIRKGTGLSHHDILKLGYGNFRELAEDALSWKQAQDEQAAKDAKVAEQQAKDQAWKAGLDEYRIARDKGTAEVERLIAGKSKNPDKERLLHGERGLQFVEHRRKISKEEAIKNAAAEGYHVSHLLPETTSVVSNPKAEAEQSEYAAKLREFDRKMLAGARSKVADALSPDSTPNKDLKPTPKPTPTLAPAPGSEGAAILEFPTRPNHTPPQEEAVVMPNAESSTPAQEAQGSEKQVPPIFSSPEGEARDAVLHVQELVSTQSVPDMGTNDRQAVIDLARKITWGHKPGDPTQEAAYVQDPDGSSISIDPGTADRILDFASRIEQDLFVQGLHEESQPGQTSRPEWTWRGGPDSDPTPPAAGIVQGAQQPQAPQPQYGTILPPQYYPPGSQQGYRRPESEPFTPYAAVGHEPIAMAEIQIPSTKAEFEQRLTSLTEKLQFGKDVPTPKELEEIFKLREAILTEQKPAVDKKGRLTGQKVQVQDGKKTRYVDATDPHYIIVKRGASPNPEAQEELDRVTVEEFLSAYAELTDIGHPNTWLFTEQEAAELTNTLDRIMAGTERAFTPGRQGALPRGVPRISGSYNDGKPIYDPNYDKESYERYAMTAPEYKLLRQFGRYRRQWATEEIPSVMLDYQKTEGELAAGRAAAVAGVTDRDTKQRRLDEYDLQNQPLIQQRDALRIIYEKLERIRDPRGKGSNPGTWISELAEPKNLEWMRRRVELSENIRLRQKAEYEARRAGQAGARNQRTTENRRSTVAPSSVTVPQAAEPERAPRKRRMRGGISAARLGLARYFGFIPPAQRTGTEEDASQ